MAIAHVANRGTNNGGTTATTIAVTVTGTVSAGNLLVVGTGQSLDTLASVADSSGNTYVVDNTYGGDNRGTGIARSIITTPLVSGVGVVTATFSTTTTDRAILLSEFSGVMAVSPLGQNTNAQGTSTAPNSGNITTATANELIIGVANFNSGGVAYTPGSTGIYSFTESGEVAPGRIIEMEWAIVGAAGTYSANGTITSAAWTQAVASYKAGNVPPAVALNSPADSGTVTDSTPDLTFTGTDTEADTIEYNIQVADENTFDPYGAQIDGYTGARDGNTAAMYTANSTQGLGQSFTGDGSVIGAATFYGFKTGNPPGNVVANIYAHTGTFGTSGTPTGAALATSDNLSASTLSGAGEARFAVQFSGANRITLTNATKYFLTLEYAGGDASNSVTLRYNTSSASHAGNRATYDGASWSALADDLWFTVNGVNFFDKVSTTDTGFIDVTNGADTHPFASGDQITYTVQAALSDDTYYWRVRGLDPSGANIYGAWSSTRSFVLDTSAPTSSIKKLNTIAIANLKKVNGITAANMKKLNGVAD